MTNNKDRVRRILRSAKMPMRTSDVARVLDLNRGYAARILEFLADNGEAKRTREPFAARTIYRWESASS